VHTVADPHKEPAVRRHQGRRNGSILLLLILLALVGSIAYPPTFLFAIRQILGFEAWRYGFHLSIGQMSGSVNDPIWLYQARLSHSSDQGTSTMLEIDKARTSFAWRHLFFQRDGRIWHDLALDGVRGTIDLPIEDQAQPAANASPFDLLRPAHPPRLLLPSALSITHASIVIRQPGGFVRLDDLDLEASDVQSGRLVIGALSVQEPWMTAVFSNCSGTILLEDSKLVLAEMKLTDSLTIASASADLPALLRGQFQMDFDLDAFSGNIQGELTSGAREEHMTFDGSGTFSNISVAQLAAFFGQDADGSIKDGKFSFHGSPRDLTQATFTTRFEAGNFRWGDRRWNSLVAGATYVDHRLQHLDFELTQAHNSLMIKGDMSVPNNWKEWWKTDFNFDVAAQIDNLTELSALLGPEFGDIFGKLTVDGSVSGENASFNGQLIVSGSNLSFRKAPLDKLEAAIKLDGNEIQVTNAEFTHGDDYLRAQGVVNILGAKSYSGEVKASIADLSLYSSFLQPPIAPQAFGGGLMLDWSGDGDSSAHSGAFTIRLNQIHPLGSANAEWQPLDLNAVATYSPDSIFFSNLELGNGETTIAARVIANPSLLTLQNLKLQHGKAVWMQGDAQIPLNAWAAWENPATASWWNFDSPCKLNLKLDRLSVGDTALLSGRPQPFEGELTGSMSTEGTLAKLSAGGHLEIEDAAGVFPEGTLKDGNASLDFKGSQLTATSAGGKWNTLPWTASGTVTAPDVREPIFGLNVKLPAAPLNLGSETHATADLNLNAAGSPAALQLNGSAQLQTLQIDRAASIESLLAPGGSGLQGSPPTISIAAPAGWKLDIHAAGNTTLKLANASGLIAPALEISGSTSNPIVSGSIGIKSFKLTQGPDEISISGGGYQLNPSKPGATGIQFSASGILGGIPFDGSISGTLADKKFSWDTTLTRILAHGSAVVPDPVPPAKPLQTSPP
jgi:hypothetical protein